MPGLRFFPPEFQPHFIEDRILLMGIENISDTALWVAVYRAMETDRPDAHFRDPYAKRLAGARGEEIVRKMPHGQGSAWAMIVRTAVMDEIILKLAAQGVDTVVNLAAGLDTRPYRLALPASLRWIEVDLPPILTYKEDVLKDEKPVCRLERVKLDLANVPERQKLFSEIGFSAKKALIITEGLLVYLTREQVAALAAELSAQSSFQYWLFDLATPPLLRLLRQWYGKGLKEGGVVMQFAPEEGIEFFRPFGWDVAEFRSMLNESRRLKRTMPGAWLWAIAGLFYSKQTKEGFRKVGNYLLKRA